MSRFTFWGGGRRTVMAAACLLLAGVIGALTVTPAQAGLTICNETGKGLSIAIGYKSGEDWMSEGWWNVDAGACRSVVDGDLPNRHYYYADANGRINGDGYLFCTRREAFTIRGDADCDERGYDRTDFAHLDTGETAVDFTLTINASAGGQIADAPADAGASDALPPSGTYGEPFTVSGTLNGCDRIDGLLSCQIEVEGWLYVAYEDNRNLVSTLDYLDGLPPGIAVALSGDMVSFGDISADVVIRSVELLDAPAASGGFDPDDVSATIAGWWVSADDANYEIGFVDAVTMEEYYAGADTGVRDYFISDACPDAAPTGTPHLVTVDRATSEQFCYEVLDYGPEELVLMYLPRGNILEFWRGDD